MRISYYLPQGMDAFYSAIALATVLSIIAWSFEIYMNKREKEKGDK